MQIMKGIEYQQVANPIGMGDEPEERASRIVCTVLLDNLRPARMEVPPSF